MSPSEVSQPILGNFIQGIKALGSLTQDTNAQSQLGPDRWQKWQKPSWEASSILAPSPTSVMINMWPSPQDQGDKRTDGDPGNRADRTHLKGQSPPPFQLGSGDVSTAGLTPSICSDGIAPGLPVLRNFSPVLSDLILPGAGELNSFYVKSLTLRFEQHISMGK